MTWHVHTGPTPPSIPSAVWALSTTTSDAINREPLRMAIVAPAALTPTDHSTAYPGGGASKKNMAVAIAFFQTAREPRDRPKHRGYAQAAPPSLFRGWHFRAPSAHAGDAESDSFLPCAAKKKRGWRRRAHDDACRRSRLLSSV